MLTLNEMQPYLDSDMQSRWFDFGGDTIVRTDSYVLQPTDFSWNTHDDIGMF